MASAAVSELEKGTGHKKATLSLQLYARAVDTLRKMNWQIQEPWSLLVVKLQSSSGGQLLKLKK